MNEILRRILFLPPQSSTVAEDVDRLHYFVIITTMAGALLVTLIGGWFVFRYRRRDHAEPQPHATAGEPKTATKTALEAAAGRRRQRRCSRRASRWVSRSWP